MIQIRMLKDDLFRAGGNTNTAIRALGFIHDISAGRGIAGNRAFRANLGTFSALNTHMGFILSGIGELCLDPERCLRRINLVEVLYRANLAAQTATGAIIRVDFDSHLYQTLFSNLFNKSIEQESDPQGDCQGNASGI
jgi:hypothetical protein